MILTHGANSISRSDIHDEQVWTKQNVPTGVQITHDFDDGSGAVPAIPVDTCGLRNDVVETTMYLIKNDTCGLRNDVVETTMYLIKNDTCGLRNDVITAEIIVS